MKKMVVWTALAWSLFPASMVLDGAWAPGALAGATLVAVAWLALWGAVWGLLSAVAGVSWWDGRRRVSRG